MVDILRSGFGSFNPYQCAHRFGDASLFTYYPSFIIVGDLQFGAAVTVEDVRLSFTHVMRTREFEGQVDDDGYGSVNLSVRF